MLIQLTLNLRPGVVERLGYELDNSGFEFRQGGKTCIFLKKSRLSLGPIQSPI